MKEELKKAKEDNYRLKTDAQSENKITEVRDGSSAKNDLESIEGFAVKNNEVEEDCGNIFVSSNKSNIMISKNAKKQASHEDLTLLIDRLAMVEKNEVIKTIGSQH